jgi:hypothetical protein
MKLEEGERDVKDVELGGGSAHSERVGCWRR